MGSERIELLSPSPPGLSIVKNMQAWPRRRLLIDCNAFLVSGATQDPLTRQVDFSSPGKPSAAVADLPPGSIEWIVKCAAYAS